MCQRKQDAVKTVFSISILAFFVNVTCISAAIGGNAKETVGDATGYSWTCATPAAPWVGRTGHTATVFHGRIWVLGGSDENWGYLGDIWSSQDGVNWNEVTHVAPWEPRQDHQTVVFENKMWVLGGNTGSYLNDVWCSSDGIEWERPTADTPWNARAGHSAIPFNNGIWLTAGKQERAEYVDDVWYRLGSGTWALATEHAPFGSRSAHKSAVYRNRLWIAGGWNDNNLYADWLNDCWYTADGYTWIQTTNHASWHARSAFEMQAFDENLWILGGRYDVGNGPGGYMVFLQDVWKSLDGITWNQMPAPPWAGRCGHASVVFDGKLWIFGGRAKLGSADSYMANDVWYMSPVTVSIETAKGDWREEGEPLDLKVRVTGITWPIGYQWMKDGAVIAGATTDVYRVDEVAAADEAAYTCTVTDQYAASFSGDPVLIRVFPAGSLPVSSGVGVVVTGIACLIAGLGQLVNHKERRGRSGCRGGVQHRRP